MNKFKDLKIRNIRRKWDTTLISFNSVTRVNFHSQAIQANVDMLLIQIGTSGSAWDALFDDTLVTLTMIKACRQVALNYLNTLNLKLPVTGEQDIINWKEAHSILTLASFHTLVKVSCDILWTDRKIRSDNAGPCKNAFELLIKISIDDLATNLKTKEAKFNRAITRFGNIEVIELLTKIKTYYTSNNKVKSKVWVQGDAIITNPNNFANIKRSDDSQPLLSLVSTYWDSGTGGKIPSREYTNAGNKYLTVVCETRLKTFGETLNVYTTKKQDRAKVIDKLRKLFDH